MVEIKYSFLIYTAYYELFKFVIISIDVGFCKLHVWVGFNPARLVLVAEDPHPAAYENTI